MDNAYVWMLSAIVFLPVLGTLVLAFVPRDQHDILRYITLTVTATVLLLAVAIFLVPGYGGTFQVHGEAAAYMQYVFNVAWIPSFDIEYFMGIDGISLPLIILTALVCLLAMAASWSIKKYVKAYCILFLLLETGMLGVFLALDFFLFYVLWEVMLLPMYFLIGVWGGPRREYAAIKFFLYTLVGSVLMLIAILMLYFNSDLRVLAERDFYRDTPNSDVNWERMHLGSGVESKIGRAATAPDAGERPNARIVFLRGERDKEQPLEIRFITGDGAETTAVYDRGANGGVHGIAISLARESATAADVVAAVAVGEGLQGLIEATLADGSDGSGMVAPGEDNLTIAAFDPDRRIHTFNLLALAAMGQHTRVFDTPILGKSLQWWAFLLLLIGFLIKVPAVPFHTWLPDAHVEAPTPISMILAGVLLKMGGYGIIRICYPICPDGGYELRWFVCTLGVVSMVYGALGALAQKDFKRMVAYSSVSHMGYVVLGLGVWSASAAWNSDYWNMGIKGAMFQMIGHGISSAGMFFLVGVIYDRVHHRNLKEFGGLFGKMPVYTALSIGLFFAALGLPGLCGFIGEVLVVLSVWQFSPLLAVISASVVILTAGYILWTIQRVYLGAEYRGPHEDAITPSNARENAIAGVLFVLAILLGVMPYPTLLRYMDPTIDRQVQELADWTKEVKLPSLKPSPKADASPDTESAEGTQVSVFAPVRRAEDDKFVTSLPAVAHPSGFVHVPAVAGPAPAASGGGGQVENLLDRDR